MPDTPVPSFETPFRQVRLNFHTPGTIQNVAAEFDPEAFAATLERARVASITCFARCHYGWLYYESKQFPERIHPHLVRKNLLLEQIEACHKRNIQVPVYTSVLRDAYTAEAHPEWRTIKEKIPERPRTVGTVSAASLCLNTPYRDFLKAHTRELLETLPLDSLYFDIDFVPDCCCDVCRAGMEAEGNDPSKRPVRRDYALRLLLSFQEEMRRFVNEIRPEIRVVFPCRVHEWPFCTSSDVTSAVHGEQSVVFRAGRPLAALTARWLRSAGKEAIGQTSRFHHDLNRPHFYKNRAALDYACFQLLSLGSRVVIDDQLPPSGRLDAEAYKLIGGVYNQVELKEPWCCGAKAVVDIGILYSAKFVDFEEVGLDIFQMLEESGLQFDVLDSRNDFSPYKALILPDHITVDEALREKLDAYLQQGGSILASHESGMNAEKTEFTLKALGAEYIPPVPSEQGKTARNRSADTIMLLGAIGKGLPDTPFSMSATGISVRVVEGSEVLAEILLPEFDDSESHHSSLSLSSSAEQNRLAGIVKCDRCVYFAHPIFTTYAVRAPLWVKRMFLNALEMLLPVPLLRHDGPNSLRATVMEQADSRRWIVHLLHYIPQRRAFGNEVLEDVIPLYETKISVRVPKEVQRVTLRPQHHDALDFWKDGDTIEFVVPRIYGHQMVCLEFADGE